MTAYAVGQITIKDPVKWQDYRSKLPGTLPPWGGEFVLRGTRAKALDGEQRHTDIVVIRFPDLDSVVSWHDSPAYQALVPLRKEAAEVDLIRYEADS